jgi:hypothetical protein
LSQDVKRKQALLGSNLSAINTLTVRGNTTSGGSKSASLFVTDTVYIAKKNPI